MPDFRLPLEIIANRFGHPSSVLDQAVRLPLAGAPRAYNDGLQITLELGGDRRLVVLATTSTYRSGQRDTVQVIIQEAKGGHWPKYMWQAAYASVPTDRSREVDLSLRHSARVKALHRLDKVSLKTHHSPDGTQVFYLDRERHDAPAIGLSITQESDGSVQNPAYLYFHGEKGMRPPFRVTTKIVPRDPRSAIALTNRLRQIKTIYGIPQSAPSIAIESPERPSKPIDPFQDPMLLLGPIMGALMVKFYFAPSSTRPEPLSQFDLRNYLG